MSEKTEHVTLPIIHLNGTSKNGLIDPLENAYCAILAAVESLRRAAPNARDYYVGAPGLWDKAWEEHRGRMQALTDVMKNLQDIIEGIENQ